jgi:hypothetical protein
VTLRSASLRGFGVDIVKEREIACRVQTSLERFYGIDRIASVGDFVRRATGERETLFVRQASDGAVEMALELPTMTSDLDGVCQIIEGVSHFVYVATRASQDRTTTALELELQAEIDKYVVLSGDIESLDVERSSALRERLYERVAFLHAKESELGERYRVANRAASRFVRRLEMTHVAERRFTSLRRDLHEMFHAGQEHKLRLCA